MKPTTRKQKNATESRETDMSSDIENIDIMLEGFYLERGESESRNFGRRPEISCYETSVNQNTNSHSN